MSFRGSFHSDRESDQEVKRSGLTGRSCWWWRRTTAGRQALASLLLIPQMFTLGSILFWPFVSSSAMRHKFHLNSFGLTLLNTLVHCGGIGAMFFMGCFLDRVGSRDILLAVNIPCIFGWICIAFAEDIFFIFLGRFIHGFCGYTMLDMVMLYVADCAEAEVRGHVGLIAHFGLPLGMTYVVIMDYLFASAQWLALMATIPPAVGFICLIFIPDSPIFLLQKNNIVEAQESLQWLRGDDCDIRDEFFKLRRFVADCDSGNATLLELLNIPISRKAIMMGTFVVSVQQLTGIHVLLGYLSVLEVGLTIPIPPRTLSGLVSNNGMLIGVVMAFLLCDPIGRRKLLILSSSLMAVSCTFTGILLLSVSDLRTIHWLLFILLFSYEFAYGCGWAPLPWFILAELLPLEVRAFGMAFSSTVNFLLKWTTAHMFSALISQGSVGILYCLYGGLGFTAALAIYCYLVETKRLSLKEIREMFEQMSSQTDM